MRGYILETARRVGFAAAGITTAEPVDELDYLNDAIAGGRIASMKWLARDPEARCDPRSLLSGARSVICCAAVYGEEGFNLEGAVDQSAPSFSPLRRGRTVARARYARGTDYHKFISGRLERLLERIRAEVPAVKAKLCVDTNPIFEKALAMRAGLGWIGRHTILLNEKLGSRFMLGEIITDLEIEPDQPATNHCGVCRACMEACPTDALISPRKLDAGRCISFYTTMDEKAVPPPDVARHIVWGTFGCDICQDACPYNEFKALTLTTTPVFATQ